MTPQSPVEFVECGTCGTLGVTRGDPACCGERMRSVTPDIDVADPSLEDVTRTILGMSETELDLCLCIMEGGEQTVNEVADRVAYDRSVVSRHLNHLVQLGVIEKRRRIRQDGGQVYVYIPEDPAAVRRNLSTAFLGWVQQATTLIDSLTREKVEAMADAGDRSPEWKIYQD